MDKVHEQVTNKILGAPLYAAHSAYTDADLLTQRPAQDPNTTTYIFEQLDSIAKYILPIFIE